MNRHRVLIGVLLLLLAGAALATRDPVWLATLTGVGFVTHLVVSGGLKRGVLILLPVLLFAGILVFLQSLRGAIDWAVPGKTIAVFLLVRSAAALLPWTEWLGALSPGSAFHTAVLFLFFLRHFVAIFGAEARRALIARRLAAPRKCGPGWFRSLSWALAGIFRRSLVRAERFYAAQALRGLSE